MQAEPRVRADLEDSRAGAPPRPSEGPIGLDGFFRSSETPGGDVLARKGRWLADDTFEIVSQSVTEGIVVTANLAFRGRELDVTFSSNQGFRVRVHGATSD